jgi:hypothetical protein
VDTGRRALLFGEVNDRIYELLDSAEPDLPGEFLCECGRECGRRVELIPAAFASLRRKGDAVRASECVRGSGLFRRPRRAKVRGGLPALG